MSAAVHELEPLMVDYADLNPLCAYCDAPAKWIRTVRASLVGAEGSVKEPVAVSTLCDKHFDSDRARAISRGFLRDGLSDADKVELANEVDAAFDRRLYRGPPAFARVAFSASAGLLALSVAVAGWPSPWRCAAALAGAAVAFVGGSMFSVRIFLGAARRVARAQRERWVPARLSGKRRPGHSEVYDDEVLALPDCESPWPVPVTKRSADGKTWWTCPACRVAWCDRPAHP